MSSCQVQFYLISGSSSEKRHDNKIEPWGVGWEIDKGDRYDEFSLYACIEA